MDSWNPREDTIRPCSSHHVLIPVSAELVTAVRRFSQTGIQDFLTLTLTERSGLLYVGAREALFAFSVEALELQGVVRGGAVGGHCTHPPSQVSGIMLLVLVHKEYVHDVQKTQHIGIQHLPVSHL